MVDAINAYIKYIFSAFPFSNSKYDTTSQIRNVKSIDKAVLIFIEFRQRHEKINNSRYWLSWNVFERRNKMDKWCYDFISRQNLVKTGLNFIINWIYIDVTFVKLVLNCSLLFIMYNYCLPIMIHQNRLEQFLEKKFVDLNNAFKLRGRSMSMLLEIVIIWF